MMQPYLMGDFNELHARRGVVCEQTHDAQGAVDTLRSIGFPAMPHTLPRYKGNAVFLARVDGRRQYMRVGSRRPRHGRGLRPSMQNASVAGDSVLLRHA